MIAVCVCVRAHMCKCANAYACRQESEGREEEEFFFFWRTLLKRYRPLQLFEKTRTTLEKGAGAPDVRGRGWRRLWWSVLCLRCPGRGAELRKVRLGVCVHTCIFVSLCMCACACVRLGTDMHADVHACMHIHIAHV